MKQYDAVTCIASRPLLDALTALGASLPITGMMDEDDRVTFFFQDGVSGADMMQELRALLPDNPAVEFQQSQVEERNWNAEFEKSLEPVRVTDRLVITQSWHPLQPSKPDELVVVIDPKMSFGTGHHESTRLISTLLMEQTLPGTRVLDIGTGTGVLAIIAVMLGAETVLAIDNNEWAVENTIENVALNNVAHKIEVRQCELADVEQPPFDIVLANIHRSVIIELLPQITSAMKRGPQGTSTLLTSGVLADDHDTLVEAAAAFGLHPVGSRQENEWIATTFRFA